MKRLSVLRGLRRHIGVTAALAAALLTVQPCVAVAHGSQPMPPRSTRSQSARIDDTRFIALKELYSALERGGEFTKEEAAALRWFSLGFDLDEIEVDTILSRALLARESGGPLGAAEQRLLARYGAWAAENAGTLDARRASMLAGEEAAKAPLAPPSNDACASAETIPGSGPFPQLSAVADILMATGTGDPVPTCQSSVSRSVWYTFTPSTSGTYRFLTAGPGGSASTNPFTPSPTFTSIADTVVAVYTGACGALTEIGCNDDIAGASNRQSQVTVELTAGTTYRVAVWQFGTTAPTVPFTGVQLFVDRSVATNDTCAGAISLDLGRVYAGTTINATNDYQLDTAAACFTAGVGNNVSNMAGRDVVYSFTAPSAGTYAFRVFNTRDAAQSVGLNPALYLSSSCVAAVPGSPQNVTCTGVANRAGGQLADEAVKNVTLSMGQTVYAYVDEPSSLGYYFFIQVTEADDETEPNDTTASASALACGATGSITPANDVDFYSLGSPASGSRVFALVNGQSGGANNNFDLRVTTTTDTLEYDDANADTAYGSSSPAIAGTILGGSASYLRVSYGSATAAEPYIIYSVVQPSSATASEEIEPNNDIALADEADNNYFFGALPTSGDVDVFAFTATAGETVFIAADWDPTRVVGGATSPFNGRIELLDATGAILNSVNDASSASSTASGAGSLTATTPNAPADAMAFTARTTGTYYVRLAGGTAATHDYLLSISKNCQVPGGGGGCTIMCPANVTVSNDAGQCGAVVNYAAPTTTGDCGTVTCTPASGSFFPVGTTTVNCSTTSGPSCSFTVTVEDDENPTVSCPSNVVTSTDPGQCNAVVNYTSPLANDNCPGATVSCAPASGSTFSIGTTTVTCTATDAAGNMGTCSFTVTVNDTQAPTISCPMPITVVTQSDTGAVVNYTTPTGSDACSLPVTVMCSPASGSTFPLGMTTVTCTATDNAGNMAMCTFPVTVQLPKDTIGIWSSATWFLRNSNSSGNADVTFIYGTSNLVPIDGDWDGDGDDTAGGYDPATGTFFLRNANATGSADITFIFGLGGQGYVPLSGDWDGDGDDTIGLYNPATGVFFLRNTNSSGNADVTFQFGLGGQGYQPIVGDWDGDGDDTVGLYNPASGFFFIKNTNAPGDADATFQFGLGGQGYRALSGDWDNDGDDSVGLYAPASATFFLKNTNAAGSADLSFIYGAPNATPLTGNWDGN